MAIKAKKIDDDLDDDIEADDDLELEDSDELEEEKDESEESEENKEESDGDESEEKVDSEREAIRERRRREKKMRRDRERREKTELNERLSRLEKENEELKRNTHKTSLVQYETALEKELREAAEIYNTAQKVMEQAITDGDGKKFAEAKSYSDKAMSRYNLLQQNKEALKIKEKELEQNLEEVGHKEQQILNQNGTNYGIAWAKKNSSWFDPKGGNRESKIVHAIDIDLYGEGYDPNTKEYWDELTNRVAEVLPNKIKSNGAKPPQRVGGASSEISRKNSGEANLPKEFIQTLKAAGYWDDPVKRKTAIKDYLSNKKGY